MKNYCVSVDANTETQSWYHKQFYRIEANSPNQAARKAIEIMQNECPRVQKLKDYIINFTVKFN